MSGYASLFTGSIEDEASTPEKPSPKQYTILLVDDEDNVLKSLTRVFRRENYQILTARSGTEAFDIINQHEVQLMISDYMMPGMNGAELLKRVKKSHPGIIRIMLTGHADTGAVMGAINDGAVYKFILKPWNDDDLRVTVGLALEQYDLIQKNRALKEENRRKEKEVKALNKLSATSRSQLAIMLNKRKLLSDAQAQELYKQQQMKKEPMIKQIIDRDWVSESQIRKILRTDLLIEEVSLAEFNVDQAVTDLLPASFCEKNLVIPLKIEGKHLMLALADPMDTGLIDDLRFSSGLDIQTTMANIADIQAKIKEVYGHKETIDFSEMETLVAESDPFDSIEVVIDDEEDSSLEELLRSTEEQPAIRLVNAIILEAVRLGVSDIHLHPRTKHIVVRYRIDGVLHDKIHIPHHLYTGLVSRIKVMAELNIAERRRPQDGRITVKTPMRIVDLRLSTLPTINGEKVVMRILDRNASIHAVDKLGLSEHDLAKVLTIISKPQGIILATGPTGSGKTTTLYSLLQHEASPMKNYVTIEDPVEYYMDTASQVHVKEKIGVNFATILRSILRQDPDTILLGEIRDQETAEVAFHAALTGHQVFSTLHTNSAVATIARLLDLGLKPYVLASGLEGIIAQRLVRRICDNCKEPVNVPMEQLRKLGPKSNQLGNAVTYQGKGCERCGNSGYRGRLPVFEVLMPDDEMRNLIGSGASLLEINRLAKANQTKNLIDDALDKVKQGLTTVDEVLRLFGSQSIM